MPGVIQLTPPTEVMPFSLCTAFAEARAWPARVNEYHDGTTQRTALLAQSRRSWRLQKRLPFSALITLREFWMAQGDQAFWFYNPKETVPPFSYDPTGAARPGRYRVRFACPWNQTVGLARADTSLDLVEIIVPGGEPRDYSPDATAVALFGTGRDADDLALPGNAVDPHWIVSASADERYPGPDARTNSEGTYPMNRYQYPSHSRWIASHNFAWTDVDALGDYIFETTFDLTGFAPETAVVSGVWSADDIGVMRLNGTVVATQAQEQADWPAVQNPPHSFELTAGFLPGVNVLSVTVTNTRTTPWLNPQVEGLLVQVDSATAHAYL